MDHSRARDVEGARDAAEHPHREAKSDRSAVLFQVSRAVSQPPPRQSGRVLREASRPAITGESTLQNNVGNSSGHDMSCLMGRELRTFWTSLPARRGQNVDEDLHDIDI